jgi:hypothetical protein
MPNKPISKEALSELRNAIIDSDSVKLSRIVPGKLYQEINEVLMNAGGQWVSKEGKHIFSHDPRQLLSGLLDENGTGQINMPGMFTVIGLRPNGERYCRPFSALTPKDAEQMARTDANRNGLVDPETMLLVAGVIPGVHDNVASPHLLYEK